MTELEALELLRTTLSDECGVDPETVTLEANLLDDLQVDSLDLLNATFRLEKECGVKPPVQQWLNEQYGEEAPVESPFLIRRICAYLIAPTAGAAPSLASA